MDLATIQRLIAVQNLRWEAGETALSSLPTAEKANRLGALPPPGAPSLAEREQLATGNRPSAGGAALSAAIDWRNKNGANWITPVEDQGACGSCVAFGCVGSLESHVRIGLGAPHLAVDLSEADLWFCWGPNHGAGACPAGGWWPDQALPGLLGGIVDAPCFPYTAANQACKRCADWQSRLTKITGWHTISSVSSMKSFLATSGPLQTCFTVYDDFYNYTSGVYAPSTSPQNQPVGGHCVCVVGYDDNQSCWICKNSWGTTFGEQGFFRIEYGQCGIDAEMWAIEGVPAAIGSAHFANVNLRMDGRGVTAPSGNGGGTVNCQIGVGAWEKFVLEPQSDGTLAIASVQFPNVHLRMDGSGVTAASGTGGGTVNCQFGVGAWEKFILEPQSDGTLAIASNQFPNVHLRMDGTGVTTASGPGGGTVNCQVGVGAWEKFTLHVA